MRLALLAVLWLCPAVRAVEIEAPKPLPGVAAPLAASLAPVVDALGPFSPSLQLNLFGVAGPGISAAHIEALQAVADQIKAPVFVHGSRQTGVRKNGQDWGPDSDLNLGVIGEAREFLRLTEQKAKFLDVPDVSHVPVLQKDSIVDAVHAGHFVVAPSQTAQDGMGRKDAKAYFQALAAPWRTENQLARLEKTDRNHYETFRFSVIGDAEPGRFKLWRVLFNKPGVFAQQLAAADARKPDFIMQLGDMVSRGLIGHFRAFFEQLARVAPRAPYLTVIGNHDRHKPHGVTDDKVYRSLFGKTDYFFDRGGWRFVTLDSSAGRLLPEQLAWLDQTLDTPLKTVVFTHMMPVTIRTTKTGGGAFAMGGFREGAEEFTRIASRRGVQRVYMGHIHALAVRDYLGVRYVLTGGGGSPLYPTVSQNNVFHHTLTVEVGPAGLAETVHLPDGRSYPLPR